MSEHRIRIWFFFLGRNSIYFESQIRLISLRILTPCDAYTLMSIWLTKVGVVTPPSRLALATAASRIWTPEPSIIVLVPFTPTFYTTLNDFLLCCIVDRILQRIIPMYCKINTITITQNASWKDELSRETIYWVTQTYLHILGLSSTIIGGCFCTFPK